MKNSDLILKLILLSVITATIAACSPGQSSSTDLSSRSLDTGPGNTKTLAVCNQATMDSSSMSANMKAATNAAGTSYRLDQAILKLSSVSSDFVNGSDYVNLWRWMASTSNSTYIDPTPLNFYLYDTQTAQPITGLKSSLKWADVSATATTWGLDSAAFFQRVVLVVDLRDVNGEFDVLKLSRYSSSTNAVVDNLDMLLPLFYANPADYAYESNGALRATVLQNLHPFMNMSGQGWSTSQFASASNSYCF